MFIFFIYLVYLFIYLFILFCLCGILDSPEHLLTVILAPGSADIDCQRDVSFLLFISSFLRDAAECKSAFSPWGVGRWGWVGGGENSGGEGRWGGSVGVDRQEGWWKRAAGTGAGRRSDKTRREGVLWWTVSFYLFLLCV